MIVNQNTLEAGVWPCVCFLVKRQPDGKTVAALTEPKTRGTAALIGSRLKRANGTAFSEEVDCTQAAEAACSAFMLLSKLRWLTNRIRALPGPANTV